MLSLRPSLASVLTFPTSLSTTTVMIFSLWKTSRLWKFIFLFCLCYFLEAITFTYLISAVQSMERQFQIPSHLSGTLVASSDIGYIPTVIILAHFGSRGNRPRWIGFGCLLISLACLLISLSGLTIPPADFGSGSNSLNASALESTIPKPLMLYSEIDTPSKLTSHMYLGCAFSRWLIENDLSPPSWAKVDEDWYQNSCQSSNRSTALRFINNSSFWDDLASQLEHNVGYGTFAKVLVEKVNAAQNYPYEDELRTENFASLLKQSKRPQALCSRLINHFRALIKSSQCATKETNRLAFSIVLMGMIAIGVGHSMPWSLGMPLIDDSVKKSKMPYFVGGVFFIRILGPMLGFLLGSVCNRLYYNLKADIEVEPTDVTWIGAWWLGFLFIAVALFIPSLMLFFFPHVELSSLENKPEQSSATVAVQQKNSVAVKAVGDRKLTVCNSIAAELKILFESLWLLIRLPVYTLCMIGRMIDVLAFKGFFVFHSKYLETHYGLPQYQANAAMGLAGTVGFALGNIAGGVILRKLKLEGRKVVLYILVCGIFSVSATFVKLALKCSSTLNQLGKMGRENGFNFTTSCNGDCHCDNSMLLPVCSSSGTLYFSPCHAGCRSSQRVDSLTNFTDCFCMDNGTIASRDFCRDDCDQPFVSYMLLWAATGLVAGTAMVPGLLIVLRYFSLHGGLRTIALLLDIGVWYFAKDLKIVADSDVKKAKDPPPTNDSSSDPATFRKNLTNLGHLQEFSVDLLLTTNAQTFSINLFVKNDIVWHLRAYYIQRVWVMDSLLKHRWQYQKEIAMKSSIPTRRPNLSLIIQQGIVIPLPWEASFAPLISVQVVEIVLAIQPDPVTSVINLHVGGDIAWHFRAYYALKGWVMNSNVDGVWQAERRMPMKLCVVPGKRINVRIVIGPSKVQATYDNQTINDIRDLVGLPISHVTVTHDVILYKIRIYNMGRDMSLLPKISSLWKFLIAFCLCFFLETMTSTYLISCVQSIERQFQITSKLSGILISSGDAGYMFTVVLLAYFGSKGNRPRWIGSGFLFTSVACFFIALPSLLFRPNQSHQLAFSNDTFDNLKLPSELITYGEVDSVRKLLAHPHIGCSIRNWMLRDGVQIPKRWHPFDQSVHLCVDDENMLTFDIPEPLRKMLLFYFSQTTTYEIFARHLVDAFNSIYAQPQNQVTWQHYHKEKLHNLSRLPSYCSHLVNRVRLFADDQHCEMRRTNEIAFVLVFIGMILIGIGHSVPWTLGVPLIDDCVKKNNAPAYFSGVFFIKILGPMVGFFLGGLCNHLYYNLSSDPAISYTDVNWIGAWWLGFLLIFFLLPAPAMMLFFLPRFDRVVKPSQLGGKQPQVHPDPTNNVGDFQHDESKHHSPLVLELRRFVFALVLLFKSPVYMLSLVGRLFEFLSYKGFSVFQTKYLESNFDLPVRVSTFYLGIFDVVVFAMGTLLGSFLIRKFRLQGRKAAAFVAACTGVCAVASVLQIFLSCNFAKKSLAAAAHSLHTIDALTFNNSCSSHCECDPHLLFPVCSSSGKAYFSPCQAGCQQFSPANLPKNFTDCFCVDSGSYVSQENCSNDCRIPIIIYFALISISGFASGISMLPSVFITLRSVPIHLKSVALGFSGFLLSLLSTLPSPIMYGHVIDSTCLLWKKSCGKHGSCSLYDVDALRTKHISLHASLRLLSFLFDLMVIRWAKGLKFLEEPSFEEREPPEEMTTLPAPAVQPKKKRCESLRVASRTARRTFRKVSETSMTPIPLLLIIGCMLCWHESKSIPIIITPGIQHLFRKYPYWPQTRDIPGYDPYFTPYSNWGVLKGFQPNDPKHYEFMQPVGLPRFVSVILNGIRLGNNGHMK
ncbi:OATP and Gal-bind lectin and Kazal 2 domain conta ining protein [Trichuris trichiura]|uniref:OATP and Gal-bind lectin and Kazal 2 domain conta ining protein n=1 Tax=Trichuris trichiura TaxID=36087 RepID=A0A077Z3S5_TRITR|nr:OATP and Gal-bind lectin and Kazal 2 domain conta ining protein [Trichuris trichiura]